MLKFIKHHLDTISDVDIYPIISLLIFFTFFTMITVRAFTRKKEYIKEISALPLEDDSNNNQ